MKYWIELHWMTVVAMFGVAAITDVYAQVRPFSNDNYESVEHCIQLRTARTATIKKYSSNGWGWTLKENLDKALAEQDPAMCQYVMPADIHARREERKLLWSKARPPEMHGVELVFGGVADCIAYYEIRDTAAGLNPLAIYSDQRQECTSEAFAAANARIKDEQLAASKRKALDAELAKRVEACRKRNGLRNAGEVRLGMSSSDAKMCGWGEPKDVNRSVGSWGIHEQWVYGVGSYLYIKNGVVASWQD